MASGMFAISNEELRDIMDKDQATVNDAISLVSEVSKVDLMKNEVVKKLDVKSTLDIGKLGIILIEAEQVKGGVMYKIFHNRRYAAHSLKYHKIVAQGYSWNRKVNGIELIEFFSASQPVSENISEGE